MTIIAVAATDDDQPAGIPLQYDIVAGNIGNAFGISASGEIIQSSDLQYFGSSAYTLTIQVTDSTGASATKDVVINVIGFVPYIQGEGDTDAVAANDVGQGVLGDCYFVAAMMGVARRYPNRIREMITELQGGYFQVSFYHRIQGTVPAQFETRTVIVGPYRFKNEQVKTGDVDACKTEEIWPWILEAAYAAYRGGYSVIGQGGDPEIALQFFLGKATFWEPIGDLTLPNLQTAFADGQTLIFSSKPNGQLNYGVVNNHAYVLESITPDNKLVLKNPWGKDHPQPIPFNELGTIFTSMGSGFITP